MGQGRTGKDWNRTGGIGDEDWVARRGLGRVEKTGQDKGTRQAIHC
jgi:hypothetical protein